MFRIFFYGTLYDDDLRAMIAGRPCSGERALLADHAVVPVGRGMFPMIARRYGTAALGILCEAIDIEAAARFSFYEREGIDYRAQQMLVSPSPDDSVAAWVFAPTSALRRGIGRWEFARWQRHEKPGFLSAARREARALTLDQLAPHLYRWRTRRESRTAGGRPRHGE